MWSISFRASALACLRIRVATFAARLRALRRAKRAEARIWTAVGSTLRLEDATSERKLSMMASGSGGAGSSCRFGEPISVADTIS